MKTFYSGPAAVWRRFMAGLTVTQDNFLEDESLWVIERTTRYDLGRLGEILGAW